MSALAISKPSNVVVLQNYAKDSNVPPDPAPAVALTLENLPALRRFSDPARHGLAAFHWKVLIARWLRERPPTTAALYLFEIARFLRFIAWKPVAAVTIHDLEAYMDSIRHLAPRTRARRLATVKSVLSWVHRVETAHLAQNVGAAVRLPKTADGLADRIMEEEQAMRMIVLVDNPRDAALLRVLYSGGIRISEAVGLNWGDIVARPDGAAQITVLGKGNKTRALLISTAAHKALAAIRPEAWTADTPVFVSRLGRRMTAEAGTEAVKRAARLAGIPSTVTAHWLRHACATHALEAGAPLPLVSQQLGHSNLAVTGRYLHARPAEGLHRWLKA